MLRQTLLLLATTTVVLAQSTMCYKENHTSPSTIESIKLDGGECKSTKSVQDMKNDGWTISNISMNAGTNGMNYMYVFSKGSNASSLSIQSLSKEDLKSTMRQLAKEEKVELEKAKAKNDAIKGESIYKSVCAKCHGQKAEIKAYSVSKLLTSLSEEEYNDSLRDYILGENKSSFATIMEPYAKTLSEKEAKQVFNYIQTLK